MLDNDRRTSVCAASVLLMTSKVTTLLGKCSPRAAFAMAVRCQHRDRRVVEIFALLLRVRVQD